MATYFQNTNSGHVIKATGECTWLWAFLFGPFYFGYKGLWGHALLYIVAAIATACLSWFVYPFFARGLVERRYIDMGWRRVAGPEILMPSHDASARPRQSGHARGPAAASPVAVALIFLGLVGLGALGWFIGEQIANAERKTMGAPWTVQLTKAGAAPADEAHSSLGGDRRIERVAGNGN